MKDKIAQIVRIVTVPPVLILFMLLILFGVFGERFASLSELIMAVVFFIACTCLRISNGET